MADGNGQSGKDWIAIQSSLMGISMKRTSPDISRLLGALTDHDVEFVLSGSVAVQAWGADIDTPGDLDIVPAIDQRNLLKLTDALQAIEAEPFPPTGEWRLVATGHEWHEYDADDPRRDRTAPPPDPASPSSFDTLFATRFGTLDVVPVINGTFEELAPRSTRLTVHGISDVRVMSIEDLLVHLTMPRRSKDVTLVEHLRALQRQRRAG